MATVIKSSGMLVREKLDAAYMELWKHDHHLSYKIYVGECRLVVTKYNNTTWWPYDKVAEIYYRFFQAEPRYHCYLHMSSYLEIFQKAFPNERDTIELCLPDSI